MSIRRLLLGLACAALVALAAAAPAGAARVTIDSDPEYVSWGNGHSTLFARGSDDALWMTSWTDTEGRWSGWKSLGGHLAPGSKPSAISWRPGHMQVFVRSVDDRLWSRTIQARSNTDVNRFSNWEWGEWSEAPNNHIRFHGSPKAVSWGDGHITVSVRGLDGAHYSRNFAFGGWGGWEWRGGCSTDDFESITWGPGRIDTFHRGCDGRLYGQWYGAPGWSGIARIGGWEIVGPPAATTWGPNSIELFYRGLNWELGFSRFNPGMPECSFGGWCAIVNLGGRVQSHTVDAVSRWSGHTAVYAQGDDGNAMWDRWWQYGGWTNWWQMSHTEGPHRDGAVPAVGRWGSHRQHVYWRNNNGQIEERWWHDTWSPISVIGGSHDGVPIYDGDPRRYGVADDKDPLGYRNSIKALYGGDGWVQATDPDVRAMNTKTYRLAVPWNLLAYSTYECPSSSYNSQEQARVRGLILEADAAGMEVVVTLKYAHRSCAARPTPQEYQSAVQQIVNTYGGVVDYWGPANEVNYGDTWLGVSPDGGGPATLAEYYAALRSILAARGELHKLLGPDFHDDVDVETGYSPLYTNYNWETRLHAWVRKYKEAIASLRSAGRLPAGEHGFGVAAALHPYGSVHNRHGRAVSEYIGLLPAGHPVWFTEVAAFRYREDANGNPIYGSPVPDWLQAARADWLTGVLMPTWAQIRRVYWYEFRTPPAPGTSPDPTPPWDTALVDPLGGRRGAWWSYCRRSRLRC